MKKHGVIITLLIFAAVSFTSSSFATDNNLSINLSGNIVQINKDSVNLDKIESEINKFDHKVIKHSQPNGKGITRVYWLNKYPVYFVKSNEKPFDYLGISFDINKNKYTNTKLLIHDISIDNYTTISEFTNKLNKNKIKFSKSTINPAYMSISMPDFIISGSVFKNNTIDSVLIEIDNENKTPDKKEQ